MKEKIIGVLTCFVLFIVIVTLFNMVQYNTILNSNSNSKLVIFGDNIDEKYVPILEDDNIRLEQAAKLHKPEAEKMKQEFFDCC